MTFRELNSIQIIFDKSQLNGDSLFPKVSVLKSQIDLFKCKRQVLEAINHWISIHPLLSTRIVFKNRDFHFEFDFNINNNLNNVKFLRFKSKNTDASDKCWQYLLDYELNNQFESSSGPLWRLYFIELDQNKYALLFNFHHAITDGRNILYIHKQLLKIIEDFVVNGKSNVINEQYEYEINNPNDFNLKFKNYKFEFDDAHINKCDGLVIPELVRPTKSDTAQKSTYTKGEFFDDNSKLFLKIDNNLRKSSSKYVFFKITQEEFTKIIQKCKENSVKITGFFEVLSCISWYKAITKYTNDLDTTIKYDVTMSQRPYMHPPMHNSTMGVYAPSKTYVYVYKNEIIRENFWSLAKKRSKELHEFLGSKEFFDDKYQLERERMFKESLAGKSTNGVEIHYYLTNLGIFDSDAYKCEFINVDEFYAFSSFTPQSTSHAAFYSMCTINGNLNWCLSYNSHLFKPNFINDLVTSHELLLNTLISDDLKKQLNSFEGTLFKEKESIL